VLDERGNEYSTVYRRLLEQFRDGIQLGLQVLFENQKLKEAQRALTQAREAAEAANRSKSKFLSALSHELRTPMNAILGLTGLALMQATDARLAGQLRTVETASRHLLEVINDVLEISRIEADRVTLAQLDFALPSVFDKVRSLTGEAAVAKRLALAFELEPALERMTLNGDALRLAQILVNYVGNAIKFTERGSVAVSATIDEETAASILLRCEVRDTGIGIEAAAQARLFGAFEQADAGIGRRYGGSGLGLSISKGLAGLMGGEVGVTSAPGQGSRFWFTARLRKVERGAADAPPRPDASAASRLRARHAGARVLLAEDDPTGQRVLQELLAHVGIDVDIAADGRAAIEQAQRRRYDLVLMDVQMPVLDGLAAARALRQLPGYRHTPLLALTAGAFSEDRRACLDAGMDEHVGKPIDPSRFFEVLLRWLEPPAAPAAAAED
ncbi:MAG: response regulator, partial [Burkholderiales bacterium]|nr:response regulator [Burkholderiales bacterium]